MQIWAEQTDTGKTGTIPAYSACSGSFRAEAEKGEEGGADGEGSGDEHGVEYRRAAQTVPLRVAGDAFLFHLTA